MVAKYNFSDQELIGKRYGRLVVEIYLPPIKQGNGWSLPYAVCKCDCGSESKTYNLYNLEKGKTISCGCFRLENSSKMGKNFGSVGGEQNRKYPKSEVSARELHSRYLKRHAGNLLFEEFLKLTQQNCYYCGRDPQQKYYRSSIKGDRDSYTFIYNGLDRVDNERGYDLDNVVPCCSTCNFMRHKLTVDEFYKQIIKIVKYRNNDFAKLGFNG